LARLAQLMLVRVGGAVKGFFQECKILFGAQGKDLLFQLRVELID